QCIVTFFKRCAACKSVSFSDDREYIRDLLRAGNTACDIANGYTAHVHDVRFEDIRVEFNSFDTPEQLQKNDDMVYERANEISLPNIFRISNHRFNGCGTDYNICCGNYSGDNSGSVDNVVCRNIKVYYDEKLPYTDGMPTIRMVIQNERKEAHINNVLIENISCNGKKLSKDDITWFIENQADYIMR
ncbi:MAG: hypothetical protein IKK94_02510, partial [Clostridia bacterium]|nr:hypothetical protein [Clostridia bacterium]